MIPTELTLYDGLGHPITSSVVVAEAFGKDHDKVMRTIRNLGCSQEFTDANFGVSEYTDPTGRKLPMYHI